MCIYTEKLKRKGVGTPKCLECHYHVVDSPWNSATRILVQGDLRKWIFGEPSQQLSGYPTFMHISSFRAARTYRYSHVLCWMLWLLMLVCFPLVAHSKQRQCSHHLTFTQRAINRVWQTHDVHLYTMMFQRAYSMWRPPLLCLPLMGHFEPLASMDSGLASSQMFFV